MKSLKMNLMVAAAALVVASGAASSAMAADAVKFEIPFAFQAADKTMAPGTYGVSPGNGKSYFILSNLQSGKTVFVSEFGPHDPDKEWKAQGGGTLQFSCSEGECELKQLWTGQNHPAVYIRNSRRQERTSTHLALIRAVNSK